MPRTGKLNVFGAHRLAMMPMDAGITDAVLRAALSEIAEAGEVFYTDFLPSNGLASYWHDFLQARGMFNEIPKAAAQALKQARMAEAVSYMAQKAVLGELDRLFESRNIRYAVIKGAHVREVVYADPALRPSSDIDILVAPEQRIVAVDAMREAGFSFGANPEIVSHEATLIREGVDIDLHWDILRPGRTRIDTAHLLLERRQRFGDTWGLDDSDVVFLMLVHPAFAKYVCSPNMDLNKVVDFVYWATKRSIDWDAVAALLQRTGLRSAAWTVLKWYTLLLEPAKPPVPENFIAQIAPGKLRIRYLTQWLARDLPTRWLEKPLRIQIGFTLFLHDRPSDAAHAIAGLLNARRNQSTEPLLKVDAE